MKFYPNKKECEVISYLFFGICTTFLNILSFHLFSKIVAIEISNILAWIISVSFAFLTNKIFVFKSKRFLFHELFLFFGCRMLSLIIDETLLILFINTFLFSPMVSKTLTNILIIAINYLLSKFLIFKKKGDDINGKQYKN